MFVSSSPCHSSSTHTYYISYILHIIPHFCTAMPHIMSFLPPTHFSYIFSPYHEYQMDVTSNHAETIRIIQSTHLIKSHIKSHIKPHPANLTRPPIPSYHSHHEKQHLLKISNDRTLTIIHIVAPPHALPPTICITPPPPPPPPCPSSKKSMMMMTPSPPLLKKSIYHIRAAL
jgi:hypothetical protein